MRRREKVGAHSLSVELRQVFGQQERDATAHTHRLGCMTGTGIGGGSFEVHAFVFVFEVEKVNNGGNK